jgi:hypothetical protein
MSNIISKIDQIENYFLETEFYSPDIKKFIDSAKNQTWSNEIFFNRLIELVNNTDNIMGLSVLFNFWLDDAVPKVQQAQVIFDEFEKKLQPIVDSLKTDTATKENIDELVNGLVVLKKINSNLSSINQEKIKKMIEIVMSKGISEPVINQLLERN